MGLRSPRKSQQAPLEELLTAIVRSLNFSDVVELDFWEWLGRNPRIVRIADLDNRPIPGRILTRISEHTGQDAVIRGAVFAATRVRYVARYFRDGCFPRGRNWLLGDPRRINEERAGYPTEYNSPIKRPFRPACAIEIAKLLERVGAGRIQGGNIAGKFVCFSRLIHFRDSDRLIANGRRDYSTSTDARPNIYIRGYFNPGFRPIGARPAKFLAFPGG